MLVLDPDIDGVVGSRAEVFYLVLEGREPSGLARLGRHLLCLSIFIREAEMPGGENDDHASRMRVQARFLMRSIVDVHHLHILILKSQLVMGGLDLGGILGEYHGAEEQDQQGDAERAAARAFSHETTSGLFLEPSTSLTCSGQLSTTDARART